MIIITYWWPKKLARMRIEVNVFSRSLVRVSHLWMSSQISNVRVRKMNYIVQGIWGHIWNFFYKSYKSYKSYKYKTFSQVDPKRGLKMLRLFLEIIWVICLVSFIWATCMYALFFCKINHVGQWGELLGVQTHIPISLCFQ